MTDLYKGVTPEAIPVETPPNRNLAVRFSEFAEEFSGVWKVLGPVGTAKYFHGKRDHLDHPLEVTHPSLDHPIHITSALCDILNVREVLEDHAYGLSPDAPNVDGLPILDIGAFIGVSAVSFASRFPKSRIHAIEPLDRNYGLLKQNASAYGARITTSLAAVLEGDGTALVIDNDRRHPYMPRFASETIGSDKSEQGVPVISLARLLEFCEIDAELGILKIDIEGGEAGLFRSKDMQEVLDRTQILMIETHDQFVEGSTIAVDQASRESGLDLIAENDHAVRVYARS